MNKIGDALFSGKLNENNLIPVSPARKSKRKGSENTHQTILK